MGAIAAMTEAQATGVIVVANSYEPPSVFSGGVLRVHVTVKARRSHRALKAKTRRHRPLTELGALCKDLEKTVFIPLLQAPSAAEFKKIRKRLFARYVKLSMAMSEVNAAPRLSNAEAFSHILCEFQKDDVFPWTPDARDEVAFCMETLQRAYALALEVAGLPFDGDRKKDSYLAGQFILASLWTQLHLDCMVCGLSNRLKSSTSVFAEMVNAHRAAVLAYAYAREGYELRQAPEIKVEGEEEPRWDEEDKQLVEASSRFGLGAQQ